MVPLFIATKKDNVETLNETATADGNSLKVMAEFSYPGTK